MKDYNQLLNKHHGTIDAVFSWHQDMAYWSGSKALKIDWSDMCTFSLAIDDLLVLVLSLQHSTNTRV
jgi:hypothetical protein